MPFNFTNKSTGDLIRSQDWNATMAAIAALYDKLDASTGHAHTGGPEDGPQLSTNALQDAAVTLQKLANLAVSSAKLATNAVTNSKIANGAVTNSKIANGAVTSAKLGFNSVNASHIATNAVGASEISAGAVGNSEIATSAVSSSKLGSNSVNSIHLQSNSVRTAEILNGAVTRAKIANGVAPEIGITISSLTNGQYAPVPSGFARSECKYVCSLKTVAFNFNTSGTQSINTLINVTTGRVTISVSGSGQGNSHVLTLAKKGGW
ncbi:MAG TPA: hypothetical protein ENJ82_13555 [Bacteroidetes bacterium]|nr:hypothetical protein [Bacteroidota bacterium]